jgi:lipopolysaccharide/colanic/teichoic acid biosynthesis glycosyltransferase
MSLVFPRPRPSSQQAMRAAEARLGEEVDAGRETGLASEAAYRWKPCPTSKRVVDCVLATIMLIFAAPLMVIFALLIRCTSRGPAIYPQVRLGWGDRSFTLYKLRTMQHDCEKLTGPCWAVPNDPRVTRIGRFLRATHMDELPQLWNVLRGEMSLIGPRPERPEIIIKLESSIPCYAERRAVLPGLTGLAQLQLPPDTDFSCVRRKLVYDLHYVERASLGLDCRILLGTACKVLGLSCQVIPPISMVANCDSAPPSRPVALGSGSRDLMPTVRLAKNSTR